MKQNRLIIVVAFLLAFAGACSEPRAVTPAFYFWKQRLQLNATEKEALAATGARKLYVKMFDVSWNAQQRVASPVAVADLREPLADSLELVPVVFLVNEVWQHPDTAWPAQLAQRVSTLLGQLTPQRTIREIQIDCDWSRTTRTAYFAFLRHLRAQPFFAGKQLSATIRLHQVKYLKSNGVPPVDKGLLMCYNMGDLRKWGDHNSILNMETLEAYTGNDRISNYPLSLDLALPLFEWTVLFRNRQYAGLLRNMEQEQLENRTLFQPAGEFLYTVLKDTTLNGYRLRPGEVLRYETSDPVVLRKAAKHLARQRQPYSPTVILYHLDSLTLRKHPTNELEEIFNFLR
ncbi:hypothetical protein EGT74_03395 [Chitinophaga lutea]|uniref:Lipoprotein n=1 Tax=Chitinophaga lutea TaxID=2488634 RepID=A0A3N4Q990_9BACT|nr:hypothetical protein [Chitinophaga lutea]RPE12607.1 hypothetical protein EGT74_03395 [Chitinophaga lutea]